MAGRMVAGSAALAGLVRPASAAGPGRLGTGCCRWPPELTGLLPNRGLRRGSTVAVATGQPRRSGGTSLMLALLAEASRAGSWCAVVGVPDLRRGRRRRARHRPGPARPGAAPGAGVGHRGRRPDRRGRRGGRRRAGHGLRLGRRPAGRARPAARQRARPVRPLGRRRRHPAGGPRASGKGSARAGGGCAGGRSPSRPGGGAPRPAPRRSRSGSPVPTTLTRRGVMPRALRPGAVAASVAGRSPRRAALRPGDQLRPAAVAARLLTRCRYRAGARRLSTGVLV